jgi:predicted small secreted protein
MISKRIWFNSSGVYNMTVKTITVVAALATTMLSLTSCGNTIRGMGQDTANTVNATQDAGRRVERAAN